MVLFYTLNPRARNNINIIVGIYNIVAMHSVSRPRAIEQNIISKPLKH